MFPRTTKLVLAILMMLTLCPLAHAVNRTGMSRPEIRSIPLPERPNRPGHFYGNTVRRGMQRR